MGLLRIVKTKYCALVLVALWIAHIPAIAQTIPVETNSTSLILHVAANGELRQSYFGEKIQANAHKLIPISSFAVHSTYGRDEVYEPALRVVHTDGNLTTELVYVSHEQQQVMQGVTLTRIFLKDKFYPLTVTLHYKA
jgi:alpha-galactosidase